MKQALIVSIHHTLEPRKLRDCGSSGGLETKV